METIKIYFFKASRLACSEDFYFCMIVINEMFDEISKTSAAQKQILSGALA